MNKKKNFFNHYFYFYSFKRKEKSLQKMIKNLLYFFVKKN